MPGEVSVFRIYPEPPSRLHYRVRVFASLRGMHGYLRSTGHRVPNDCRAMCCRRHERDRLGELVFARYWLGTGIITHECTHAAVWWLQRCWIHGHGIEAEERFAGVVGDLTCQMARQIYDRGLGVAP